MFIALDERFGHRSLPWIDLAVYLKIIEEVRFPRRLQRPRSRVVFQTWNLPVNHFHILARPFVSLHKNKHRFDRDAAGRILSAGVSSEPVRPSGPTIAVCWAPGHVRLSAAVLLANSDLLDTWRVEGLPFRRQLLRYGLFWQRRGIAFAAVRPFRWRCLLFGANSYADVNGIKLRRAAISAPYRVSVHCPVAIQRAGR